MDDDREDEMMLPALSRRPTRVVRAMSNRSLVDVDESLVAGGSGAQAVEEPIVAAVPQVAYRCMDCGSGPFKRIGLYTHYRTKHLKKKEGLSEILKLYGMGQGQAMYFRF